MARPKKDIWADLDPDFKTKADSATKEQITALFAQTAKSQAENLAAMKDDQDLQDKIAITNMARSPYKETTKQNRLRAEYLRVTLNSQGG